MPTLLEIAEVVDVDDVVDHARLVLTHWQDPDSSTVKVMIRMPPEMRKAAKIKAAIEDTNVSAVVRTLLTQWLLEQPP